MTFPSGPRWPSGPSEDAKAVTPNNSADLPNGPCAKLWIGAAGHLKVTTLAGTTVTILNVANGTLLDLRVRRVHATDTTATSILALY